MRKKGTWPVRFRPEGALAKQANCSVWHGGACREVQEAWQQRQHKQVPSQPAGQKGVTHVLRALACGALAQPN